ncbi:MAG: type II toxin-antitoxin system Phd/YefM family antitoxin [bacterium]
MPVQTTYTQARANFAKLLDQAADDRETVIINRRRGQSVALIAADELSSLQETAHLLRSPRNAERLLRALARALARTERPRTIAVLRRELGLRRKSRTGSAS